VHEAIELARVANRCEPERFEGLGIHLGLYINASSRLDPSQNSGRKCVFQLAIEQDLLNLFFRIVLG